MFKIDDATAVAAMPALAAAGSPGFFSEGDPVSGQPATVVSADFLNILMMELANIVLGVGSQLAKGSLTQVRESMPRISGNSAIFPSGLIVNWGNDVHGDNSGAKGVGFATPFRSGVAVSLACNQAGGPPTAFHGTGNHGLAGMTVYSSSTSGVAAGAGTAFRWIAIGS
jgi:hypothetical protein